MSRSLRRRSITPGDMARGLGALVVLGLLVAGVPFALWVIDGSPLPSSWPDFGEVRHLVTSPDDGSLFVEVLILAGWAGWATFAVSVLVEIPAAVGGVVVPNLPGLGAQQRFAGALVTAVVAMVPATQVASADPQGPWEPAPPITSELTDDSGDPDTELTEPSPSTYEVVPGDTLWSVAESQLGDPRRYTEIFDASSETVQPDGRTLSDPNLIVPGWVLTVPEAEDSNPETPSEPTPEPPPPSQPTQLPEVTKDAQSATGDIGGTADRVSDDLLDCLAADGGPAPDDTGVSETAGESTFEGLLRTGGGVGAVLAAGLMSVLTARRAMRQRRRRAGQRFVEDLSADRAAEIEMRQVADPSSVKFVDLALRALAARMSENGRGLPALRAARLTPTALELYPEVPGQPPAPFDQFAGGAAWSVDVGTRGLLDTEPAAGRPAPYPSLVTLGHDTEDALLFVDLEYLGSLTIDGPDGSSDAVMTAVAAEFATSPWADDIRVTLVGRRLWTDLELLETGRVRHVTDVDRLLDELTVRAADDRKLLNAAGVNGLRDARGHEVAEAAWTPEVVLVAEELEPERQRRLDALVETAPRVAIAAITAGQGRDSRWTLKFRDARGNPWAVLEPLGMNLRVQCLDVSSAQHLFNLLRTSDQEPVGQPRAEPSLHELPALPAANHPGFEPLLRDGDAVDDESASNAPADGRPRLIMLGRVEVIHTAELGERNKLGQLTELAMFVALNPGCDTQDIDEAIWPGSAVTRTTRNTAISKLRRWLGTDDAGSPLLPRTEGRYTFRPDVRSDWDDWCELLPGGPAEASTADLQAALALVKGRPFGGRGRRSYAWVDHHAQNMIVTIIDACHELAVRSLKGEDPREAHRVALLGLSIEPGVELLWRDRLKAELVLGDRDIVIQSIEKLRGTADELGGDLEEDTEELIQQIISTAQPSHPAVVSR